MQLWKKFLRAVRRRHIRWIRRHRPDQLHQMWIDRLERDMGAALEHER